MIGTVLAALSMLIAAPAPAEDPALFALVLGVNESTDSGVGPLLYADDDAFEFARLFERAGAKVTLLVRPDAGTRRLYPEASARAAEPTREALALAVRALALEIQAAHAALRATALYVIYTGHGNVGPEGGYLSLADSRLTGSEIASAIVSALGAGTTHLIVDACHSYYVAHARGPGGERRAVPAGFGGAPRIEGLDGVGLLMSTSSAQESHEWEGFQAGVFSYEVRSGLYGAADADGDGRVSYSELGAFVTQANAAIPNDRFRPRIYTAPPPGADTLLDLRPSLTRRIELARSQHGHYVLEDAQGVRLAEFHNAPEQAIRLLRPNAGAPLYLQRVSDRLEFEIPERPDVITLAGRRPAPPRERARGAAHLAFRTIFTLPFGPAAVDSFAAGATAPAELTAVNATPEPPPSRLLRTAGWVSLAAGGLLAAAGVYAVISAESERSAVSPETSHLAAFEANRRVADGNHAARLFLGGAVVGLGLGGFFLWWDAR